MKWMKKTGLLVLLLFCILIFTSCRKKYDIKLDNWYDFETGETLFTVKAEKVRWHCSSPYYFSITIEEPKENISELIKASSYYVSEYQLEDVPEKGELFFSNNNYYFGYSIEDNNYILINMIFSLDYENGLCYIPFPSDLHFSQNNYEADLQKVFSDYSYAGLKDFYSRFNRYVSLNDEKEEIRFETKKAFNKKEVMVHLNFKEKYLSIVEDEVEKVIYRFEA